MKVQLAIFLAAATQQVAATQLKAFTNSASCGGTPDFTWQDPGVGCLSFNGNTDMYSLRWAGPECSFNVYPGSFDCTGSFESASGDHFCINRGGNSIKSVRKNC